jgi:hypothetical protein
MNDCSAEKGQCVTFHLASSCGLVAGLPLLRKVKKIFVYRRLYSSFKKAVSSCSSRKFPFL